MRIAIVVACATLWIAGRAAADSCEDKCDRDQQSCLDTNAQMRLGQQYPDDGVCYRAHDACYRLCAANRPAPRPETDAERRAREAAELQRKQSLKDSFGKKATPPVSEDARRDKKQCLGGDAFACLRLQQKPAVDKRMECHDRQTVASQTCQSKSSACRTKCSNDRFQCWKNACDAACAKNPNGLQCNLLCACQVDIPCDCDFCAEVRKMCPDEPKSGATPVK